MKVEKIVNGYQIVKGTNITDAMLAKTKIAREFIMEDKLYAYREYKKNRATLSIWGDIKDI